MKKINYVNYDKLFNEIKSLSIKKNADYGCNSLLSFGGAGLIIRISDKIDRLKNLIKNQLTPKINESTEDNLKDIINYCYYLILLNRGELLNEKN